MCTTPSFRSFPNIALETGPMTNVHLIDDNPLLFFQGRSSSCSTSSVLASLLQAIDGAMSLPLSSRRSMVRCPCLSPPGDRWCDVLASLLQAIDGAMSLALCPQVVSQALQHFKSSEKQATCEGCFARQSVCSVISLHSAMLFIVQVDPTSLKHKADQIPWTSHKTMTTAIASTCACSAKMQRTS